MDRGDERKRTIGEVSKDHGWRQNWSTWRTQGLAQREPVYCLGGVRHRDGMTLIQAFVRNRGNLSSRCEGRSASGGPISVRVPMRDTGAEQP